MAFACGDCFRWAAKRALKAFSSGEPLVMVHATVQPSFGITAAGEVYPNRSRFAHAWIERRGKVMDWQTANGLAVNADGTQRGRMHLWPKDEFYEAMQPRDIQRYTPEQAALMPMRTRNYGPWTDAERREHADLMARVARAQPLRWRKPEWDGPELTIEGLAPGNYDPVAYLHAQKTALRWVRDLSCLPEGYDPLELYSVSQAWVDPPYRGQGHGKRMYQLAMKAIGRRGGVLVPNRCVEGGSTSSDAERVWESLTRRVARRWLAT